MSEAVHTNFFAVSRGISFSNSTSSCWFQKYGGKLVHFVISNIEKFIKISINIQSFLPFLILRKCLPFVADVPTKKHQGHRQSIMFEGKNIHSSPIDGKLLCSYSEKLCKQRRLNGYAFCIRHVLEDRQAPFKQCQFVAKYNGHQCTNPIPLSENRM